MYFLKGFFVRNFVDNGFVKNWHSLCEFAYCCQVTVETGTDRCICLCAYKVKGWRYHRV